MVVDTSALVAVLRLEERSARLARVMADSPDVRVSAASLLEATIVLEGRFGEGAGRELDLLLHRVRADVVNVTLQQVEIARSAFRRFGKGRHPAALNFGDCFSYALAASLAEPLLFVGDDFSRTDLEIARY